MKWREQKVREEERRRKEMKGWEKGRVEVR